LIFLMLVASFPETKCESLPVDRLECKSMSSDKFYFPEGWVGEKTTNFDSDQFLRRWYSKHLRTMSEPSLSCKEPSGEIYRFLWLRTWGHPIAVRIDNKKNDTIVSAVELDGAGGYEPGKVLRRIQRKLTQTESKQVSEYLKAIDFWKIPTQVHSDGLDGAQWIVEGRRELQYHVVDRWSPESGSYHEFCIFLLKLAGMLPSGSSGKKDDVY
jgi:hypothetical protein